MAGRKVFVGSLPDGIEERTLREEFGRFGEVDDIFVKPGCDPGRQWAMVTFATSAEALQAKEATDRILQLPGSSKPIEVMIARNQGRDGNPAPAESAAPKKIHVGSLPDSITEDDLREEFSKFGHISDIYLKTGNDQHKQWAFITFSNGDDAEAARKSTDRVLRFPDSDKPCEVMLARNQGMNGQNPLSGPSSGSTSDGPTKIFVGSLPDDISESVLRSEFSRFGQIQDVFLKTGCERHKQWAFILFATHSQALRAKDETDRRLMVRGADNPCEVMFAKFQGKRGTDPLPSGGGSHGSAYGSPGMQSQFAWRVYQTPQGLAYYHNHATGVTQWECPPEMRSYGYSPYSQPMYGAMYGMPQSNVYRPY